LNNLIKLILDLKRHFVYNEICDACEKEDWKSIRIIHGEVPLREINKNWRRFRRELKVLIWITIVYVIRFQQLPYSVESESSDFIISNDTINTSDMPITKSLFLTNLTESSYIESKNNFWDGLFL
jgi:hypothetical protein